MAKTVFHMDAHSILDGLAVCELWCDGAMIGTVTGGDNGEVRVISKHPLRVEILPAQRVLPEDMPNVNCVQIIIKAGG